MEHQQQHPQFSSTRTGAKLPPHLPPPSSSSSTSSSPTPGPNKYTTIERKSIVRMLSNGPLDDGNGDDSFVRRSTSNLRRNNMQSQHRDDAMRLLDFGTHSHISQLLDRIDSLSLSNLHQISGKPFSHGRNWRSPLSSHSPVQNNSTSGYDSNSSSSLLSGYFYPLGSSGASTSNTTIRRIPSVPNLRPSSAASSSIASSSGSSQPCTNTSPNPLTKSGSIVGGGKKARPNSMHIGKQQQITLKDDVIKATDKIEKRVAFLREVAQELLIERNKLENAIEQVKQCCTDTVHFSSVELEEIFAAIGLLQRRLQTVNIGVSTPRSTEQTAALNRANKYVDELRQLLSNGEQQQPTTPSTPATTVKGTISNAHGQDRAGLSAHLRFARQRCLSYISSCSSDGIPERPATPIDEKFQRTVIECTVEDQKEIRRALESILAQFNQNDKS